MTDEKKELKVEFAPGAFNHFEGTQEELDEMMKEIQELFANSTPEELSAMSRPLTEEDLDDLPEDVKAQLIAINNGEDLSEEFKRKLQ